MVENRRSEFVKPEITSGVLPKKSEVSSLWSSTLSGALRLDQLKAGFSQEEGFLGKRREKRGKDLVLPKKRPPLFAWHATTLRLPKKVADVKFAIFSRMGASMFFVPYNF